MPHKKLKVLFIKPWSGSTFIENDLEILKKYFNVTVLDWSSEKFPKFKVLKMLFKNDINLIFIWFAARYFAPIIAISKLFGVSSIVIAGGYDVAYVPEINYGQFTMNWHKRMLTKFTLKHADMVLPVSNFTKNEILKKSKLLDSVHRLHGKVEKFDEILDTYRKLRRQPTEKRMNNLNSILEDAINFCNYRAQRYNLQILEKFNPEFPDIFCSEFGMLQVFVNLIFNGLDAMVKGKGSGNRLGIKTDFDTQSCRILFSDEGCGIPQKYWQKIFDPLFSTKVREGGTGTGLASAMRVIKEHKGSMRVKSSRVGKGTSFEITIPIEVATDA